MDVHHTIIYSKENLKQTNNEGILYIQRILNNMGKILLIQY